MIFAHFVHVSNQITPKGNLSSCEAMPRSDADACGVQRLDTALERMTIQYVLVFVLCGFALAA